MCATTIHHPGYANKDCYSTQKTKKNKDCYSKTTWPDKMNLNGWREYFKLKSCGSDCAACKAANSEHKGPGFESRWWYVLRKIDCFMTWFSLALKNVQIQLMPWDPSWLYMFHLFFRKRPLWLLQKKLCINLLCLLMLASKWISQLLILGPRILTSSFFK